MREVSGREEGACPDKKKGFRKRTAGLCREEAARREGKHEKREKEETGVEKGVNKWRQH